MERWVPRDRRDGQVGTVLAYSPLEETVATRTDGNVLVLHRGPHPIMEFESGWLLGLKRHSSLWMVH